MSELSADRVRALLLYDRETGVFTWRVRRGGFANVGSLAGAVGGGGYLHISIDGRLWKSHRLAWLYARGEWPRGEIDHMNGVRTDNRIENLRDVPRELNMQNRRTAPRHSASKLLGASWHKRDKRWCASIHVNGVRLHLGRFATQEEAHAAYVEAKRVHHEGCTL